MLYFLAAGWPLIVIALIFLISFAKPVIRHVFSKTGKTASSAQAGEANMLTKDTPSKKTSRLWVVGAVALLAGAGLIFLFQKGEPVWYIGFVAVLLSVVITGLNEHLKKDEAKFSLWAFYGLVGAISLAVIWTGLVGTDRATENARDIRIALQNIGVNDTGFSSNVDQSSSARDLLCGPEYSLAKTVSSTTTMTRFIAKEGCFPFLVTKDKGVPVVVSFDGGPEKVWVTGQIPQSTNIRYMDLKLVHPGEMLIEVKFFK